MSIHSLVSEFRSLCEELSSYIEQEGLSVRPYSSENLPYFLQLPQQTQEEVTDQLHDYLSICKNVYKDGHQLKETSFFIRKALEYYQFDHDPKLFEYIEHPRHIAEFYNLRSTQFFRTLNFFEVTSYTIEDIYCRKWVDLYERDEEITQMMYEKVMDLVRGRSKGNIFVSREHVVKERVSLERLELEIRGLHISTLHKNGELVALASVINGRARFLE
ncbi:MAG: hypothetical protein KUL82_07190 [Bdellovibrio sp.]|nr:hypothetical protein [Bdellovibrio sp.]